MLYMMVLRYRSYRGDEVRCCCRVETVNDVLVSFIDKYCSNGQIQSVSDGLGRIAIVTSTCMCTM